MDALASFAIPLVGMQTGVHQFDFQVDKHFFQAFESSPIKEGSANVQCVFEKKPELSSLSFAFEGHLETECDRCLEAFTLPVESTQKLMVKFSEEESDDPEMIFISKHAKSFNVAKHIYEFILLAIPMIKTHDLAGEECDEEMLKYLNQEENDDSSENPAWDALKNWSQSGK